MDSARLLAWWAQKQGLDGSLEGASPRQVLERTGWSRSVGGVGPYLTLFSRAGLSREAVDAAVAALEVHELPSARGCTYVVPRSDFALALTLARLSGEGELRVARSLGVTDKEIETLCTAVVKALAGATLDPEAIRDAVGGKARSLGDAGKKKGLTTTLPVALGLLQTRGEIRRVPIDGRLDQQRYRYTAWAPSPAPISDTSAYAELARLFFRTVGPATLGEFQYFSALGVKAAKVAVAPLELVPVEPGSERLCTREDAKALADFELPKKPRYVLISGLDPIAANRRDVQSLLSAADQKRKIFSGPKGLLADLESHAILDRGRIVGLWDYDFEAKKIVWASLGVKDKALDAAVEKTEAFVRDQLGDARSFSLDSPESRKPRLAALRRQNR